MGAKNKIELCCNCKYFRPHSEVHNYGFCHRHSPTLSRLAQPNQIYDLLWNEYCDFPNVAKNNFCGDFELNLIENALVKKGREDDKS